MTLICCEENQSAYCVSLIAIACKYGSARIAAVHATLSPQQ